MTDTTFRTKVEQPTQPRETIASDNVKTSVVNDIEVPYRDYRAEHGQPYTVDHFELGSLWDNVEGGFSQEVNKIEGYINSKIESGEIANSIDAVKKELKTLEKLTNIKDETRKIIKIETLSAYIDFLNKTKSVKNNYAKYGNS